MKTALIPLLAVSLAHVCLVAAETPGKVTPRFKARVVCFNGQVDAGGFCAATCFQPDGVLHRQGAMRCGFPGQVSQIEWSFVERRGARDVYRFTRRFPVDTAAVSTTNQTVEFSDRRVVVFEDAFQVVVMEPPENEKGRRKSAAP
jgi:hypothetical protein